MWNYEDLPSQVPIPYELRNLPRPTYNEYRENKLVEYKPKGKRYPLEIYDKNKLIDNGLTFNLTAHDPQLWNNIIDFWKYKVVRHYIQKEFDHTPSQMYQYLETFLGETARAAWKKI